MTVEHTVEFDEWIDAHVESVRESFADTQFGELDYDTTVNMLVLGGLVFAPDDPTDPRWAEVYDFLEGADVQSTPRTREYGAGADHQADETDGRRDAQNGDRETDERDTERNGPDTERNGSDTERNGSDTERNGSDTGRNGGDTE